MNTKHKIIIAVGLIFTLLFAWFINIAFAAPTQSQSTRDVIPFTDSKYYIGTTTPTLKAYLGGIFDNLTLSGLTDNSILFIDNAGQITEDTNFVYLNDTNFMGIGTTSPYAKLSVVGEVVGEFFTATSTTATSLFNGDIRVADSATAINTGTYGMNFESGVLRTDSDTAFKFNSTDFQGVTQLFMDWTSGGSTYLTMNDGGTMNLTPFSGYKGLTINPVTDSKSTSLEINHTNTGFNKTVTGIAVTIATGGSLNDSVGIRSTITGTGSVGGVGSSAFFGNNSSTASSNKAVFYATGNSNAFFANSMGTGAPILKGRTVASYGAKAIDLELNTPVSNAKFFNFESIGGGGTKGFWDSDGNIFFSGAFLHGYGNIGNKENMVLRSEDTSDAVWVKTAITVTPDDAINPFGVQNADKLTTTASTARLKQTLTGSTADKTFRYSFWYRHDDGPNWQVQLDSGNESGTVTQIQNTGASGDWKFFSKEQTFSGSSTGSPTFHLSRLVSGDIFYVWGLNISETSEIVSYMPTLDTAFANSFGVFARENLLVWTPENGSNLTIRQGGGQSTTNLFQLETTSAVIDSVIDSNFNWGIGTTSPTSLLHVNGSRAGKIKKIYCSDSPYTAGDEQFIIADTLGCNIVVNFPPLTGINERMYNTKNVGNQTLFVVANGSDLIDGFATATVSTMFEAPAFWGDTASSTWRVF